MTGGEELWKRFLPRYLEALGAPVFAVGMYGASRDLVDALLQYPGGWATDRFGRRAALMAFIGLAALGYAAYLAAPSWQLTFLALPLVMCWSSAASPTVFAIIGDALPPSRRTMGFTVQSIMRRIPIAIAPSIGGLLIATHGIRGGVRAALGVGIASAMVALVVSRRIAPGIGADAHPSLPNIGDDRPEMPRPLRRLLASDILVRTCESMVDVFIVVYATRVLGVSAPQFGLLVAVQMVASMVVYVPAVWLSNRIGRKPLVTATFVAFALFPISVIAATGFAGLVAAFVVGGLREIGEPARKAVILDLADARRRGRTTGSYYLVRGLAITPAAIIGALLWRVRPELPFVVAAAFGLAGAIVFAVTVPETGDVVDR